MVTRRGAGLLAAAVVLWGVGRFLGVAELYVAAVATLALVVAAFVAVRVASATISARRGLSAARLLAGETGHVRLDLRNDARLPAALLLVEDGCPFALGGARRFVVADLGPGRTATISYPVTGEQRGRYTLGPVQLRVRDPFGLAEVRRRYTATDEVLVYPPVEALPAGVAQGGQRTSGSSQSRRVFTSGDEFHTLREYAHGDDLRHVHWPSTAHRQQLMVRQHEQSWEAQATVLLDTRARAHRTVGPDSGFEKAVAVAASVVWHLADERYQVRLVMPGDDVRRQPQPWNVLLDRLAEVQPSTAPHLPAGVLDARAEGRQGVLCAVVAPPPDADARAGARGDERRLAAHPEIRALLQAGRRFDRRLAVIVAHSGSVPQAYAELLAAAGWRAIALRPNESLAARWPELGTRGRRTLSTRSSA